MKFPSVVFAGLLSLTACATEPPAPAAPSPGVLAKTKPGPGPSPRALPMPVLPEALSALTAQWQNAPVSNPPAQLWQHRVDGRNYFYRPAPCCDFFSELYDEKGVLLCHPDGGISGRGDGRCTWFRQKAGKGVLAWRDKRDRRMEKKN